MSDSSQHHGLQPTRLLCPWKSPGKSTGVGCHALLPNSGVEPESLASPALAGRFFTFVPPGKPKIGGHFTLSIWSQCNHIYPLQEGSRRIKSEGKDVKLDTGVREERKCHDAGYTDGRKGYKPRIPRPLGTGKSKEMESPSKLLTVTQASCHLDFSQGKLIMDFCHPLSV